MKLSLTRQERSAIFRGDDRALRRVRRPAVRAGDRIVLSYSRGGRQVVDRETGATVEIPREPTVWIEVRKPELRGSYWLVRFAICDRRQPIRRLGATPGPHSSPALKTRLRTAERARKQPIEPWTPETERGYSGGKMAIDPLEAVGDDVLAEFSAIARRNSAAYAAEQMEASGELRRRRERAVRSRLREALASLQPEGQLELLAAIEREIEQRQAA
jgi:hypothetical protein